MAETRKRSLLWKYFKDLGDPMVKCRLCATTLRGNMARHLKCRHPVAYEDLQRQQGKYKEQTFLSKRWLEAADQSWFKNYVTKENAFLYKCTVCKITFKYNNLTSHMREKHPDIFEDDRAGNLVKNTEEMETSAEESERSDDECSITSRIWVYFKELVNSCPSCKLCGDEIENMEGHLMEKHPDEYLRLKLRKKIKGNDLLANGSKNNKNKRWERKYVNISGPKTLECDVCKKVISTSNGNFSNVARHFKTQHPYIYARERNQHLGSEDEQEKKSEASGSKTILNKGWVRKYVNRLSFKEHECIVCKSVLKLPHGFIGNMRRHFKSRHPSIYARENNRRVDSVDSENETHEEVNKEEKTASCPYTYFNRGWVRKYVNRLGFEEHECIVCNTVLKLPHGFIGNMRRHFRNKHPAIYERENNLRVDSVEDENKETESSHVEETYEIVQDKEVVEKESGDVEETHKKVEDKEVVIENIIQEENRDCEEEYVIEYLLEENPTETTIAETEIVAD